MIVLAYIAPTLRSVGDAVTAADQNIIANDIIDHESRIITYPSGRKNLIINGAFSIDQRNSGAAQTITSGAVLAYTADRWYAYCTGASVTGQRVATGVIPNQYNYKFTGAASNTLVGFGTRLEQVDTFHLAGQTVTLSAYLASSTLTSVTWSAYYATTADTFGTIAAPTRTLISTGTFTISATMSVYNAQISVPSAATTGLEIVFTTGALVAAATLTFAGVQLEQNTVVTVFEREPIQQTLAKCFRYYWIQSKDVNQVGQFWNYAPTTNFCIFTFPVQMRILPVCTVTGSFLTYYYNAGSTATLTLTGTGYPYATGLLTHATSLANYNSMVCGQANSSVVWSAEL